MPEVNKGGRPKKLYTAEEKREAANAASRESRRRKRQAQQVGGHTGFEIQLDPLSILQQAGPKGGERITVPNQEIQAEGFLAEEDNEVADTDRVAKWQLTASTHSLSSVHESPRSQLVESTEPALLSEEEDGAEDADQVGEIGDISGTAEVSTSGSWHGAFDDSGDNDNGGDSDDSDSVQPATPLTDNSLYSELGGEAGLTQLSDNVDWAADSNTDNASNSNDGPEDQRARQADSSEHTADDRDDGVDQEQYTRAAAARLKIAWNKRCTCGM